MLKIVPEAPSPSTQNLKDLLIQISDHLLCASVVVKQTAVPGSKASVQVLSKVTLNEIELANHLVDVALSTLQVRH